MYIQSLVHHILGVIHPSETLMKITKNSSMPTALLHSRAWLPYWDLHIPDEGEALITLSYGLPLFFGNTCFRFPVCLEQSLEFCHVVILSGKPMD